MLEQLTDLALSWGFPVLLAALLASGFGVPVPEDIPLLLTGFLCEQKGIPWWFWALGCYGVVMVRDTLVFSIGRYLPERFTSHRWFQRVVPDHRQRKFEGYLRRKGWQTVFAGRFMPGFRVVVFFVAGRCGVPYRTFFASDGVAGLISIPLLVWLGFVFSHELPWIQEKVKGAQTLLVVVLILYFTQSLLRSWLRVRRAQQGRDSLSDD